MEEIFIRNNDNTFVVVSDAIAKENSVSHINNTYKAKSHDSFWILYYVDHDSPSSRNCMDTIAISSENSFSLIGYLNCISAKIDRLTIGNKTLL